MYIFSKNENEFALNVILFITRKGEYYVIEFLKKMGNFISLMPFKKYFNIFVRFSHISLNKMFTVKTLYLKKNLH